MHTKFWYGNLKEGDYYENVEVDGIKKSNGSWGKRFSGGCICMYV
jgi:hypothetical protein